MFDIKFVFLYTDLLLYLLLAIVIIYSLYAKRQEHLVAPWRRLAKDSVAMGSLAILLAYILIGVLDSVHFRPAMTLPASNDTEQLPEEAERKQAKTYSAEVLSLLDLALTPLRVRNEKTYSAPFASYAYSKESIEQPDGSVTRDYPKLVHGGAHLLADDSKAADIAKRTAIGLVYGAVLSALLLLMLAIRRCRKYRVTLWAAARQIVRRETQTQWRAFWLTATILMCLSCVMAQLSSHYHVFGTDKIGQDVLYQSLKSIRTGLLIGTLTTLVMLPFALLMGIAAGYFRGWIDDVIQYIYTTLNSIPSVLLIAASVLMLQVYMDNNSDSFSSLVERADMRLLFLCIILGITSWTGLCRYMRAETLKLREMDYVAAARSQGVGHLTILGRHILPNVMHIVLITVVLDFSALVLAEAVLAYVQIGVDPSTESWGNMINGARLEMAREPIVWWSLAAAFVFMFALVLAANLFADAVRDSLDPHQQHHD